MISPASWKARRKLSVASLGTTLSATCNVERSFWVLASFRLSHRALRPCSFAKASPQTQKSSLQNAWGHQKILAPNLQTATSYTVIHDRFVVNMLVGGGDEPPEQRMRLVWLAQEFRVKLARDEKRMVFQLYDFHEL